MVKCLHRGFHYSEGFNRASDTIGSLQMFMKNFGSCEDIGPGAFPLEEVHEICALNIRLVNADRHADNILIHRNDKDGQTVLIMVTYCLRVLGTAHLSGCTGLKLGNPFLPTPLLT